MSERFDLVAVGECLVDFVGEESFGKLLLEGNPGGAPANVLAMGAKLGLSTALITKVGEDPFGQFLERHLQEAGISTEAVIRSQEHPTTLAMVQLDQSGDRSFNFYRHETADVMLTEKELPLDMIRKARIFHFGSVSLSEEPARSATFAAAKAAKEAGALISFDPNLRPPLWKDMDTARRMILKAIGLSDLVKLSEEELYFLLDVPEFAGVKKLMGMKKLQACTELLAAQFHPQLLSVTMGDKGCLCRNASGMFYETAYSVETVDTTGAGDAYWGATLRWLIRENASIVPLPPERLAQLMNYANAAGSLTTTKKGAIPALPDHNHILECVQRGLRKK